MTGKRALVILLTTLWTCLTLLGGCAPQVGDTTSTEAPSSQPVSGQTASTQATPTPGPQSAANPASLPPDQDLDVPWAQEGILVKLTGYTDGENEWAVLHDQDQITLLTVTPEIEVVGGPLKEGQRVAVTCQEILTIYPSLFYQVSAVEVLGELSPEEWDQVCSTVEEQENSLQRTAEFANELAEETPSGE
ncbi:MAG: hypothetical protein ACOYJZ_00835 [Acutalibacter sp.]|jgi:hypothetical protein